ncbi:MAG TPA: sulfatase/phosphatase domain-containing protein, partial [Bacilli bacterium]
KAAGADPVMTDGRDFKESIDAGGYPYIFSEGEGFAAISDGRWKYIHVVKQGKKFYELFDMEHDPFEFDNVIAHPGNASITAELRKQMTDLFMKKLLA